MTRVPWRTGVLLVLLPLVFTGKAFLRGDLYGPADLYYQHEPWKAVAAENGVDRIHNPILSDLAFANLPWRAAVREAFVNGRLPLWNRFVLGGNPLLGTAQAAVFHPSTWLGLYLPLALSWTYSCAFTIFLALLCGWLFFRELCRSDIPALVGAVGWGFSTFVLFWDGWAVGPSIAGFPLLLLGLRRIARGGENGFGITAAALLLSATGGHPETLFHCVAGAGVYFLFELFARDARPRAGRAIGGALGAGLLAAALAAPVLLPLLEALPHSAEYASRREALAEKGSRQSVPALEAARRLRPAVLPFAHGIYGKSPVQERRHDGSGMPLAYAGAVLFPLAIGGLRSSAQSRERWIFLAFVLLGFAYGASAPLLLDATSSLPGFALALNYRLVFLAPLGLAGLAALGADRIVGTEAARRLATAALLIAVALTVGYLSSWRVYESRELPDDFLRESIALEVVPVVGLAIAAAWLRKRPAGLGAVALTLLVGQRFLEMRETYPTLRAGSLAPPLPVLAALPPAAEPRRIVATGAVFRPNGAALYGLEDVRGYESLVLNRFAETYPMWCRPQHASHNRVDDLTRPFLAFVNARYAIAEPGASAPDGWSVVFRGRDGTLFENPSALPRAFVPARVRVETDARKRLREMSEATDFGETAWLSEAPLTLTPGRSLRENATFGRGRELFEARETPRAPPPRAGRGYTQVTVREIGTDLVVEADVAGRALVVTSVPDWPGWRGSDESGKVALTTVNHAFVGFWLEPGKHAVRLHYLPGSFLLGSALAGAALLAVSLLLVIRRNRR